MHILIIPLIPQRSAVENVPEGEYLIPLGKARIAKEGKDVTGSKSASFPNLFFLVVGYGAHMLVLQKAVDLLEKEGISVELIDLSMTFIIAWIYITGTLAPWDKTTVINSVKKTGRLVISHEAPKTCGFAAEIAQTVQEEAFNYLEVRFSFVCCLI